MRSFGVLSFVMAGLLSAALVVVAQQGPKTNNGDTVARPKKGGDAPPTSSPSKEEKLPPLPSVFKRGPTNESDQPVFKVDATTDTLDVSVVDPNGHFIPNLPETKFRILEDNVPQKISSMTLG